MNSDYKYDVVVGKKPMKFLKKQDRVTRERIWQAIKGLEEIPPKGDIVQMQGQATHRLRIGPFRVIFETDNTEMTHYVIAIGNRGDIYK